MTMILTMTWTCNYIASFSSTLFANSTPATEHVAQIKIRHLDAAFCAGAGAGAGAGADAASSDAGGVGLADVAPDAEVGAGFSGALAAAGAGAGAAGVAAGRDMLGKSLAIGPVYSGKS